MSVMPSTASVRLLLAALLLAASGAAALAGASPWSEATGAKLRLIAPGGPPAADGTLSLGLEIVLDDGWKTYWRHPGEAGLPPEIDLSNSTNLASAEIAFPAPRRFVDGGATSLGYRGDVVLPIRLTPEDPALPVMVDARVQYGACKELCVPAAGAARLMVSLATRPDAEIAARFAAAEAAVPAAPAEGFAVTAVAPEAGDPRVLVVTATLPDPAAADLFAEGPGAALPSLPVRLDDGAGTPPAIARWRLTLDERAAATGDLRLTLVNGERAIEQVWELR
jgi:DsbC/DsbD-like thiol-disulfide interchange protein